MSECDVESEASRMYLFYQSHERGNVIYAKALHDKDPHVVSDDRGYDLKSEQEPESGEPAIDCLHVGRLCLTLRR